VDEPEDSGAGPGTEADDGPEEPGGDSDTSQEEPSVDSDGGPEDSGDDSRDGPAEPEDDRDGTTGGSDGESEGSGEVSISALEYNKVMRLLQNREFPVDRMEIEAVASNAYELSEAECAEVIDIAIDRGLLAEEGGELLKPE
jgi:hypothetical protein